MMKAEQTAIILEVVSFFLVTLDLYGRERIIQLGDRFHRFAEAIRGGDLRDKYRQHAIKPMALIAVLVYCLLLGYWVSNEAALGSGLDTVLTKMVSLGAVAILLIIIVIVLFFLFEMIVVVVEFFVDRVLGVVMFMMVRLKLEGLFLIIGSIIFVVSKIISLTNQ
jgi:hypothetical protein